MVTPDGLLEHAGLNPVKRGEIEILRITFSWRIQWTFGAMAEGEMATVCCGMVSGRIHLRLQLVLPARSLQKRHDVFPAGIGFHRR